MGETFTSSGSHAAISEMKQRSRVLKMVVVIGFCISLFLKSAANVKPPKLYLHQHSMTGLLQATFQQFTNELGSSAVQSFSLTDKFTGST